MLAYLFVPWHGRTGWVKSGSCLNILPSKKRQNSPFKCVVRRHWLLCFHLFYESFALESQKSGAEAAASCSVTESVWIFCLNCLSVCLWVWGTDSAGTFTSSENTAENKKQALPKSWRFWISGAAENWMTPLSLVIVNQTEDELFKMGGASGGW